MDRKIRYGILGYARIAENQLIPAMATASNAVPYAIASSRPESLAAAQAKFGFPKAYADYGALLQDPMVDAVYIPLPNALHKEWTLRAVRAGKHVLCEKPLALSEVDCLEMASAAQEHGVLLMEAFMYRFTTRTHKLMELLDAGAIGEVRHINSGFRFYLADHSDIRLNPELGGGSLWDVGCYPVNLLGMILKQEPESVRALQTGFQGVDRSLSAVLRYPGGVLCTINSGFDSHSVMHTEINGTEGTLLMRDSFDETDTPLLMIKNDTATDIPVPACSRYVLEIEEFSSAILEGRAPALSLQETLRNVRLIERILRAAAQP